MALASAQVYGRDRKVFVSAEAPGSEGTFVKPVSADAARVLKLTMTPETERKNVEEHRSTRSMLERFTGKSKGTWSLESRVVPSGTAGTPPDLHLLFKAILGSYTNTPATSDVYALSDSNAIPTVSLTQHFASLYQEAAWGCWVDSFSLSLKGNEEPKLKWDGGMMGYAKTGVTTLNGAMVATDQLIATAATSRALRVNSVVKIGADTNSGAGYQVTADGSRPTFTISDGSPPTSVSADTLSVVAPFVPTETVAGTPQMGLAGSVTVAGSAMPITGLDLSIKTGSKGNDDEALHAWPTDVIMGDLEWTGSVSFRARADQLIRLLNFDAFATYAITAVVGNTAGNILTIAMPYVETDNVVFDAAESEEVIISLPFTARGSSGADNGTFTFT